MKITILTACIAILCACTAPPEPVAAPGEPMLHPRGLRVSGPDQFGVVCYSFAHKGPMPDAVSCVQVTKRADE